MKRLRVTLIDVGWGDSLFLESEDDSGHVSYALIDSNDDTATRSSYIFIKRFFERHNKMVPAASPLFDWVLLSHAHADHGQGLKRILRDCGTKRFWYSHAHGSSVFFTTLVRYAKRSSRVSSAHPIDDRRKLPKFGAVQMDVLWPPRGVVSSNENDNSVVLALTLGGVTFVLTGDAEADGVWSTLASQIPGSTRFFKVPHHGAANGTFDHMNRTPWLNALPAGARVAISSHVRPFPHPDPTVTAELNRRGVTTYRTDEHVHVTFETDGTDVEVRYSHV